MSDTRPVVALVGPTASGKTALSIDLAERVGAEIISMDSRQVYRGMEIGTAKVSPEQRARVPHHGLDLIDPNERFSAGRFARYARRVIEQIDERGNLSLLVGGTGFFLRSLTHPIFREPDLDPVRRGALERYLAGLDDEVLRKWLAELDPATAQRLRRWGGRQRLLRALELPILTGRPLSWWHAHAPPAEHPLEVLVFVLDMPRDRLRIAIDARVAEMVRAGLLDEVERLLLAGFDEKSPGMSATGYIELIPYFRGETTLDEALDRVRRNTWAYARRQMTWLRKQLPQETAWLDATEPRGSLATRAAEGIERYLDSFRNRHGSPH
jgi:tRNA dimethylallyltransferase